MEKSRNISRKPASNERIPGQGNSNDGLTRRLGSDKDSRGNKEVKKMNDDDTGEEHRVREGSQGNSRGQKSI